MAANGRLTNRELGSIPGGRLEKATAASWLRLRAHIGNKHGVWICPTSTRTAYRTYGEQQYFWNLYTSGRGNLAARPGSSNHGWGLAVDVATTTMARLINQHGAPFGWQKRWSDAPSEWWHFKYSPSNDRYRGRAPANKPKKKHPYHYMTKNEKKWRNVLLRERKIAKRSGGWSKVGGDHLSMAKRAKKELRKAIKRIDNQAKSKGSGGYSKAHRKGRKAYMQKLIKG
jgi:hypothetical protein